MRKRLFVYICLLALLVSFLSPVQAKALSTMTCSEDCVAILKEMEGFSKYPYLDGGQYTVGYGSGCAAEDLERYQRDGITKAEAETLMNEYLRVMEASLNNFADKNKLNLSQNRFDALMLFTYNVGTGWMNEDSDLRTAIVGGAEGNDFIYYLTRWCMADTGLHEGLVKRRLAEANLYLNGVYSTNAPSYYSYVLFDAGEGSCPARVQGYDMADTAAVKVAASSESGKFLGWYTAAEGGRRVTDLDKSTAGITLYARYQVEGVTGTPAQYQRQITQDTSTYADDFVTVAAAVKAGETVSITMDYVDANGIFWGKTESGWVNLADTQQKLEKADKPQIVNVTVTVTHNYVNVRKGPGTSYGQEGRVYYGDRLVISQVSTVGNAQWGRFSGGWLSLQYTDFEQVKGDSDLGTESVPDSVIATGIVVDCTALRIRSGAGTSYATVGSLTPGTVVQITQRQTVGTAEWGRIDRGWICLQYVRLDDGEPEETTPETTQPEETTPPETQPEETTPPETQPEETTPPTEAPKVQTGTVINCQVLNVRSAPGTHNPRVTGINRGTKVEISETATYSGQTWGHIPQGWVSMVYIQLDYESTELGGGNGVKGTVVNCNKLNVRPQPSLNNTPVGYLMPGNVVTILEQTTVGSMTWGRTQQGWVSMDYIRLSESSGTTEDTAVTESTTPPSETPQKTLTGAVTGTNALRIRSGAGTHHAQVGTLTLGTAVNVYEQTTVNGIAWGRVDGGWVCMTYIALNNEDGSFQATVIANGLNVRSAAGTNNPIVGAYKRGDAVIILETTGVHGVAWGKTDQGWICLQYVKR